MTGTTNTHPSSHPHPVVITGVGLSACLGLDAETVWSRVRRGECGIGAVPAMESPLPPNADGGQAPDLPPDYAPDLPRAARYLRWVIEAALRTAGLSSSAGRERRVAIVLGTTLHGMRAGGEFLRSSDHSRLGSFLSGDVTRLATAGLGLAGLGGTSFTTCSACSSGLGAVALGVTLLQQGEADLVLAGGYDTISEYAYAGFGSLRLVSDGPLRPFAKGRKGMKLAEGYGLLVLEREPDAIARAAPSLARVSGWGESADAFHLTRPEPGGTGAAAAMRTALSRAGLTPPDLGLVVAHATGTPDNDAAEYAALRNVLADHLPRVPVVGFKSHLGHTLGGAGAVELILAAFALRDGVVPPTANVSAADTEFPDLDLACGRERPAALRHTLGTSLGFGGANTCVVLSHPAHAPSTAPRNAKPAPIPVISGVGVLVPGLVGNDAFAAATLTTTAGHPDRRTLDDSDFEHLVAARRIRRMSPYVKLSLCAATLAARHARLEADPDALAVTAAILGTTHGSAAYCYDYYAQIVRDGVAAANPMLFAEGVPNAAAAQVSLMLGLRGGCQTVIGSRTAGVEALRLAAARVRAGDVERVLVIAAEEPHFTLDQAYQKCRPGRPESATRSCAAAVAFVVERDDAARRRGVPALASLGPARSFTGGSMSALDLVRSLGEGRELLARPALRLGGDCFSAEPLLALAASVLRGITAPRVVVASDRGETAVALAIDAPPAAIGGAA